MIPRSLPVALLLTLAIAAVAGAHALDPALLELREDGIGVVDVEFRAPAVRVPGSRLEAVLPDGCRTTGTPSSREEGAHVVSRWRAACGSHGLVGGRVGVDGLGPARTDALVRITLADGRTMQRVVRSREPHFTVSVRPSALRVLADYVRLGIDHILSGADHLLFVFGLVLLVGGARRVAATVTAFTIGHSITLAAVTLDLVRVPAAPAELLIALSVFVLAVELARPGQPVTLVRRFSGLMAGTFGLLHGFGFAGSLREAGLPSGDVPLALLGFNVGVEFGQIAFVACVLVARRALDRLPLPAARLERVPVYVMGSLAALWCFQRAGALLP